ncbi:DNA-protecting protein DprA [Candidatus Kaiserbacteria bacterium]|nr:MAG: DNA-protecting protein DprA [Candidatus Kaiserbacteria bacterium]
MELEPSDFPPLIKEISDPPKKLFSRGDISSLYKNKVLTVVGSRKATSYGTDVTKFLIEGLKGHNITILSGLALGTDTNAHRAAISAGLTTIAVPGSGLDDSVMYPKSNLPLVQEILKSGGGLLSELEPKQSAAMWTFPKRNRIMAGLSHAVLVIEAASRSGTLITARLTTEYNRDLLVVPSSIFAKSSEGAHQFLKLGATPVTNSNDILRALGIEVDEKEERIQNLSEEERHIYDLLETPQDRDEIVEKVKDANILIAKLEVDGIIFESKGKLRRK